MLHPFEALAPEYAKSLKAVVFTRLNATAATAHRLLSHRDRYAEVAAKTGVPLVLLAALHERESGGDFSTYLGNGEPIVRVTRLVPRGRGPFSSWESGAEDAIAYDRVDQPPAPWSMVVACWTAESWNGFGYRAHGVRSPYLWGGTSLQMNGKYVADGRWDPSAWDTQLGVVPIMMRMIEIAPDLAFEGDAPSTPGHLPVGVGAPPSAGNHDTAWLQANLNAYNEVHHPDAAPLLLVDGNYGRMTRAAVRAFQAEVGITVDGVYGPETERAILSAVAAK